MLAVTRRLLPADDYVRSGNWAAAKPSPLMRPQPGNPGRRVGVYGMGEIGRKIAARVAAFETEVGYFSRSRHDVPYRYLPSLEALAEWCSVLMIAVRAGADTHHVVDAGILRKLGKDGYVVNISRGSVIDQAALVAALADKTIAGAGLDVYEKEPHAPDALTAFPNVVLTPHVGGHTIESHIAMQDCVIANLEAFFAGKTAGASGELTDRRCAQWLAGACDVTQFVGIAYDVDRGDPVAVDCHAQAVIDFAVQIEQGAHGSVDRHRFDANVVAAAFARHADEETRDLVGADDRIERCGFAAAAVGHRDRILAQQSGQTRYVAAGNGFAESIQKPRVTVRCG